MTRLIGLTGLAGAGKDEAAKALVEDGWKREAFADRMRTAILALDPWVDVKGDPNGDLYAERLSDIVDALGWDTAKREFPEVRRLLQKFGTEAGRDIHGLDCWVDLVITPWRDPSQNVDRVDLVVTDVRFENEAQAIREAGGVVVRITRPGLDRLPGGHASEAGFPERLVNWTIFNDGPIEKLHAAIRYIARSSE